MNLANRFTVRWITVTSLGWLFAQSVGLLITRLVFPVAEERFLISSPIYWILFGALFGLSQWINIRDHFPNSFAWVWATALGCFTAAVTLKILNWNETINSFFYDFPIIPFLFGGIVMSFAQYQAIKENLQKAYWWILIAGISWGFSQSFIGILLFATVTGIGFTWLLQKSVPEIKPA